jgi:translation elongation factor EF-1beta
MYELQESIKGKGQLLYLSKRAKHEDVSLFIHTVDPNVLGDFIVGHLNGVEHITDIWVINMIKPIFYPLPKDTGNMKRFTITLKVFPKNLKEVYQNIASATLPDGLKMAYIAYTFHLFGDSIQLSILTEKEETLNRYLTEVINRIPGVVNTTVNLIERTRPLVSYEEWKQYSSYHNLVPSWDEDFMINQFQQ